jgi:hypothetical protein
VTEADIGSDPVDVPTFLAHVKISSSWFMIRPRGTISQYSFFACFGLLPNCLVALLAIVLEDLDHLIVLTREMFSL